MANDVSANLRAENSFLLPRRIVEIDAKGGKIENAEALTRYDREYARIESPAGEERPYILFDFEREVAGMPFVECEAGADGVLVIEAGPVKEALWWKFELPLPTGGGVVIGKEFAVFQWMKISVKTIVMAPDASSASIRRVGIKWTGAPMEDTGDFSCSDELLTRIWRHARYTVEINTQPFKLSWHMINQWACPPESKKLLETWDSPISPYVIWDGPRRDRELWLGDLRPSALCCLYGFAMEDSAPIVHNCLVSAAKLQWPDGWIPGSGITMQMYPEYAMWWLVNIWDYYMNTGDEEAVRGLWPNARLLTDRAWLTLDEEGLYKSPAHQTWAYTLNREGYISESQWVFAAGFAAAAKIAELLGHPEDAERWAEASENIVTKSNEIFWMKDKGAYADYQKDGKVEERAALDGNIWAITLGAAPAERAKQALDYIKEHHWTEVGSKNYDVPEPEAGRNWVHNKTVWPFIVAYEVEARLMVGDIEGALELTRRCWGNMLDHGTGTFWEFVKLPDGGYPLQTIEAGFPHDGYPSLSHAWSGYVSYLMQAYVLGVKPAAPGFTEVEIEPQLGSLEWADGVIPTPFGPISVELARTAEGKLSVNTSLPEGVIGRLILSKEAAANGVIVNGYSDLWDSAEPLPNSEFRGERMVLDI